MTAPGLTSPEVLAERERCARIAEGYAASLQTFSRQSAQSGLADLHLSQLRQAEAATEIAEIIRCPPL